MSTAPDAVRWATPGPTWVNVNGVQTELQMKAAASAPALGRRPRMHGLALGFQALMLVGLVPVLWTLKAISEQPVEGQAGLFEFWAVILLFVMSLPMVAYWVVLVGLRCRDGFAGWGSDSKVQLLIEFLVMVPATLFVAWCLMWIAMFVWWAASS